MAASAARESLRGYGRRLDSWSQYLVRWFGGKSSLSTSAASPLFSSLPISSSDSAEQHSQLIIPGLPYDGAGSMEVMAVPKKKVSPYKKGLRNGPKALKPAPVIVRCKSCGRVKLPHFYCCSGEKGAAGANSRPVD